MKKPRFPAATAALADGNHTVHHTSSERQFGKTQPLPVSLTLLEDYLGGLETLLDRALQINAESHARDVARAAVTHIAYWRAFIKGVSQRAKVLEELIN